MNRNHEAATTADLALNVEVSIDDQTAAAALDVDTAARVLVAAGVPIVGLPKLTSFDGCYHVDVPAAWWNELEESGDDFDATAEGYDVHICTY